MSTPDNTTWVEPATIETAFVAITRPNRSFTIICAAEIKKG